MDEEPDKELIENEARESGRKIAHATQAEL